MAPPMPKTCTPSEELYQVMRPVCRSTSPGTSDRSDFDAGQQRISTPLAAKMAPISGRKRAACVACTSSDSVALQGLYFCVLALSVTFSASARSTSASI